MASGVVQASGAFIDFPGSLERFSELETNDSTACLPKSATTVNVPLVAFTGADMVESWRFEFDFKYTFTNYGDTVAASPWFPYIHIQTLEVPYQSSSFKLQSMDGHLTALTNAFRPGNKPHYVEPYMLGQAPTLATGYTPEANLVSASNYAAAANTAKEYKFPLEVLASLYFDRFYDVDNSGKTLQWDNVYVSPLIMSSTGRNIVPKIMLNPAFGATEDIAPFTVTTASGTAAAIASDQGSTVFVRRNGWRQPSNVANMPPIFNWAHQWFVQRVPLGGAKVSFQLPSDGQVLCVIGRMFDPTLASGVGGAIAISNLVSLKLTYGSGINKFFDTPISMEDRIFRQHGFLLTKGVFAWDMYTDTRSNLDAINTYTTASPLVSLDFTGNTPGASSYVDIVIEYLTLVGN